MTRNGGMEQGRDRSREFCEETAVNGEHQAL